MKTTYRDFAHCPSFLLLRSAECEEVVNILLFFLHFFDKVDVHRKILAVPKALVLVVLAISTGIIVGC